MKILTLLLILLSSGIVPGGEAYYKSLQGRDTLLIADQLEYGFQLQDVSQGTEFALPDFKNLSNDTLVLVRGWQLDTLKFNKRKHSFNLKATVVLSPFEEGEYVLPSIPVVRSLNGRNDSLLFDSKTINVQTVPVDTSTFEIRQIKEQVNYPVTFSEFASVAGIVLGILALIVGAVFGIRKLKSRGKPEVRPDEPAHVIALRELDKYRSNKYWAPDKQKAFYSGITDALKNYIDARYGIDAPEMTTAELFSALKGGDGIDQELFAQVKSLFETADFVKFAKHIVSDQDNANALPVAVKFVTSTYQTELEEEQKQ